MRKCDACGNEYDKTFTIDFNASRYTFDCFECAIQLLAPVCKACGVKIIGHGVEKENNIFCCANCAESFGIKELRDRA